jgi:hypothetical protein
MPSTFSPALRLELIGNGEQAANWGNTTNTNLGTLLEQAITGVGSVTMVNANYTLVSGNGVSDEARNAVLVMVSGVSLTATRDVIVPTSNKFYAVRNATTGGQSIVIKTSAGTGVTLANGFTQLMYCDGTNVVLASLPINSTTGSVGSLSTDGLIVSTNSSTEAVRITQTGSGNAILVEDSANPDATPFVVNATGKLIVGATTLQNPRTGRTASVEINSPGTTTEDGLALTKWVNTANSNSLVISRSRGATVGTQVIVSSNDVLSEIFTQGSDGTQFIPAASIAVAVDGTPGTNDMPGRLTFSTTADGADTPTERMRIDNAGRVGIGTATLASTQQMRVQFSISDATANAINLQTSGTHTLTSNNALAYTSVDAGATVNQATFNATASLVTGGSARGQRSIVQTSGTSGTVTAASGFVADVRNTGAGTLTTGAGFVAAVVQNSGGGTLTNAMGFYASPMTGGTNNFGFYSDVASAANRWNFYANGTADNYFAGQVQLAAGSVSAPALAAFGDTNTGMFFPAADTIALGTNGTERARITSGGDFQFNSGYGSVATAFGCRAWVNFNGTGTVAIRASGNVSSITDQGTGIYRVNFSSALVDGNYAMAGMVKILGGTSLPLQLQNGSGDKTASYADVETIALNGARTDAENVDVIVVR